MKESNDATLNEICDRGIGLIPSLKPEIWGVTTSRPREPGYRFVFAVGCA